MYVRIFIIDVKEAAVHKFLSNHPEKLFAGTREARRAF